MNLTLSTASALAVLRELRRSHDPALARQRRVDLMDPNPGERGRWSRKEVAAFLSPFSSVAKFSRSNPLYVSVPSKPQRLRMVGTISTIHSQGMPPGAFLHVREGLCISSPELLFFEMSKVMNTQMLVLLGMELCGTFVRDPINPRSGKVAYGLAPVTSASRLREFAEECRHVDGASRAREAVEWVLDNAWSPMEAVVAALAVMPPELYGYDLWPVWLNPRVETGDGASADSRVPDMRFGGTDVGLNYDGDEHLPLGDIAQAAMNLGMMPGEREVQDQLERAIRDVRASVVSDKRRDRDLGSLGMTVLPVTKEDLFERGGLDKVMRQVISAIEHEGKRNLPKQRTMLESPILRKFRQDLIWSTLPWREGIAAARRLEVAMAPNPHPTIEIAMLDDEGWRVLERRTL